MRHRLLTALLLALFLCAPAAGQSYYKEVEGTPSVVGIVEGDGAVDGRYVRLATRSGADTLWVWAEHVKEGEKPNYDAASQADAVVWCYPNDSPHEDHVLPNAKGKVVAAEYNGLIVFTEYGSPTHQTIKKYGAHMLERN